MQQDNGELMKEYRCKFCHKRLFKYRMIHLMILFFDPAKGLENTKFNDKTDFEIKCPKCKTINKICVVKNI